VHAAGVARAVGRQCEATTSNLIEFGKGFDRDDGLALAILFYQILTQKIRRMNRHSYRARFYLELGVPLILLLYLAPRRGVVDVLPRVLRENLSFSSAIGSESHNQ
jgi:hypothetical protein